MATGVGRGKMRLAAFDGQFPKTAIHMRKNLVEISCTSRVIASFVQNFVAMATGVGRGKNEIGSIRWPIPENPL